jgi:hypothetical protein
LTSLHYVAKDPCGERHLDFAVDLIYPYIIILLDKSIVVTYLIGEKATRPHERAGQ